MFGLAMSTLQNVGDVDAPHLVWPDHGYSPQEVRVNLMLRVWVAGVRPWRHAGKAHLAHQALYPFAVDHMAPLIEKDHHSPATVEWMAGVFLVY